MPRNQSLLLTFRFDILPSLSTFSAHAGSDHDFFGVRACLSSMFVKRVVTRLLDENVLKKKSCFVNHETKST